jgi:cytochrome c
MHLRIKSFIAVSAFLPLGVLAEPALTFDQGEALAKQKTCLGCHQVNAKRVGPGFVQIAQRYHGQSEALDYLANVIRQGGRGKWGAVPMPAQSHVTAEQALQLAQWTLSLVPN